MDGKNKEQKIKDGLSIGLLGIAAVLIVVMVVRLMVLWTNPVIAAELLNAGAAASENAGDDKPSRSQETAKALKEKNMFMSPSKPKPPNEVKGIFGKQALIGGKWYKVGDTVPPGAKILSIEATQVKLEWEGKEIVLAPIKAADSAKGPKPPKNKEKKKSKPIKNDKPQAVQEEEEPQESVETDELAWLGVDLPANVREKFLETWNQMTDEQKEKTKEGWSKMPDEQKQQAVDSMSRQL